MLNSRPRKSTGRTGKATSSSFKLPTIITRGNNVFRGEDAAHLEYVDPAFASEHRLTHVKEALRMIELHSIDLKFGNRLRAGQALA